MRNNSLMATEESYLVRITGILAQIRSYSLYEFGSFHLHLQASRENSRIHSHFDRLGAHVLNFRKSCCLTKTPTDSILRRQA